MTTTPEATKGVPRVEGNPAPTLRADHNALADWVRDNVNLRVLNAAARDALVGKYVGMTVQTANDNNVFLCTSVAGLGSWLAVYEDTAFLTPALNGGWTNEAANGLQYKKRNGVVYMRGRATSSGADLNAFQFPVGFRPDATATMVFPADVNATTTARVYVTNVGIVQASAGTLISFDGVRFPVI